MSGKGQIDAVGGEVVIAKAGKPVARLVLEELADFEGRWGHRSRRSPAP